jgi:hypothetical protein
MDGHPVFSHTEQGKADGAVIRILQHYQRLQSFLKPVEAHFNQIIKSEVRMNRMKRKDCHLKKGPGYEFRDAALSSALFGD